MVGIYVIDAVHLLITKEQVVFSFSVSFPVRGSGFCFSTKLCHGILSCHKCPSSGTPSHELLQKWVNTCNAIRMLTATDIISINKVKKLTHGETWKTCSFQLIAFPNQWQGMHCVLHPVTLLKSI